MKKIKYWLIDNRLTQKEAAKRLGINPQQFHRYCNDGDHYIAEQDKEILLVRVIRRISE